MKKSSNQEVVVKSNKLIETGYRVGKREQYFVLYLISRLDSMRQKDFREFKMTFSEIKSILNYGGTKRVANRDAVFEIMNNLNRTPIYWEKEDEHGQLEERGQMTWISSLRHNVKSDTFTFTFDPHLKPFLLQLEEYFTKYALHNVRNFSKSHSIRMYEILKVYEHQRTVELTIQKLKFYLGVGEKYEKFYELKRWVLEPTRKELEVFTDIRFDYQVAKKIKKKAISVKFSIYPNFPKNSLSPAKENSIVDELGEIMLGWGISRESIKKYRVQYSEKHIRKRVLYVQWQVELKRRKKERIHNIGGYLHKLMKDEAFSSNLAKEETEKKEQKRRTETLEQKKEVLRETLKNLYSELHQKEVAIIEQLFEEQPNLKTAILKEAKEQKFKYYDSKLSDEANYQDKISFRTAVHNMIRERYATRFELVQSIYKVQIDKVKRALQIL